MSLATTLMAVGLPAEVSNRVGYADRVPLDGSGITQVTATQILAPNTNVALGTSAGDTAFILPADAELFQPYFVLNTTSDTALIYPPVGDTIDAGALNGAVSLDEDGACVFQRVEEGRWVSFGSGAGSGSGNTIRSITEAGAKCDGVTLDDAAWAAIAQAGGYWWHPGGTSLVSRTVLFRLSGTQIFGTAAGYGDSFDGAKIKAATGFVGDDVVRFGDGTANMRSVGFRNIEINGGADSDAHGLTVDRGYDAVTFENVTVLKIGNGRHCFNFTADLGLVGQTITSTNLFGLHRNDTNDAAAFRLYHQQECTFINCKGWGASSTAGAPNSAADVWDIDSCSGITLLNCSAVATVEHGFLIRNTTKYGTGIQIINPTIENVGKPLRIVSEMALTFASGGISPVPAIGDIVSQPADGSTATGRVWFATSIGIYVTVLTGEFALAPVYAAGGVSLGTLTQIRREAPKDVKFVGPRFYGAVAGVTGTSLVENAKEFDIEWLSNDGVTPVLTIAGAEASGELRTTDLTKITNQADYTLVAVRGQTGTDVELLASDYYDLYATNFIPLPMPVKGKRVHVMHDLSELLGASIQLYPGVGVSIDRGSAGSTLYLSGNGSAVVLWAVSSTEWRIESFTGAISVNGFGYRMTDRGVIDINASITIGYQTFGYRYTNDNATLVRTLQLTAIGTTSPLATNGGYRFTRTNATNALRIDPNAADQIVGSSGAGKYLQIDTVGATVELRVLGGKWCVFGDATTYSFEP